MTEQEEEQISVQIQASAASVSGKNLADDVLDLLLSDLSNYTYQQISDALRRVRVECSFFNTKEIVSRIDDGRPLAEEAWGMLPKSESDSVVWTVEMQEAFGAASPLLADGDKIGARMAFLEKYRQSVNTSRAQGIPTKWQATLGHDQQGRETALTEAVNLKRISREHAIKLLPSCAFKVQQGGLKLLEAAQTNDIETLMLEQQGEETEQQQMKSLKAHSGGIQKLTEALDTGKRKPYPETTPVSLPPTDEEIMRASGLSESEYKAQQEKFKTEKLASEKAIADQEKNEEAA